MPECHKCPEAEKVQRGDYARRPWSKTPCAKCHWTGDQENHHGRSHISMQAGDESDQTLGSVAAAIMTDANESNSPEETVRLSVMAAEVHIGRGLLYLTDRQREIALLVFHATVEGNVLSSPITQCQIAHRARCTPQNLSTVLREIVSRWPEFASILDYKSRVQMERFIKSGGRK